MNLPSQNRRKIFFIEKQFQAQFILKFSLLVLFVSLGFGLFLFLNAFNSTTIIFKDLRIQTIPTSDYLLPNLALGLLVTSIVTSSLTLALSLIISHRIGGPMFRFKKALELLKEGDLSQKVQLREYDQCKDIAITLDESIQSTRDKISEIKNNLDALNVDSFESEAQEKISRVKTVLGEFKL